MPEPEPIPTLTAPADQPEAQPVAVEPTETALTRAEVQALISAAKEETLAKTKDNLDAAYKTARRSESKGDTAAKRIERLEVQLEALATRGMDDSESRAWKAERALERATEATQTVSQQQEYERAAADFQQRSASFLNGEGIKSDDQRLTAAFSKFAADARSYDDWDKALLRAVAEVHKDERTKLTTDSKAREDKIREEERAKLRNEQKATDGPIDKGQPGSTSSKPVKDMSDEEFKVYERQKDDERIRRRRTAS